MKIIVNKKMGDSTFQFEFEGSSFKEAFHKASFLAEQDYCWLDGFKESKIQFEARKVKTDNGEFIYVKRKAFADGKIATSTLGEYQGGGYFWKKWEVYTPDKKEESPEETGTPF